MIALSLASILELAASMCPEVIAELPNSKRLGESFSNAIQKRFEDAIIEDDDNYKTSLEKKIVLEGGDKYKRRLERKEARKAIGPLLLAARKAYTSYIRGYSAKEKAVRHIFSSRALHLGHVARSFALKEQPNELSKSNRNDRGHTRIDNRDILKSTGMKRNKSLAFDESRDKADNSQQGIQVKSGIQRMSSESDCVEENIDTFHTYKCKGNAKRRMLTAAHMIQSNSAMEFM